MKKRLSTALLILGASVVVNAATLPASGKSVAEIVPEKWENVSSAVGDVNKDGIKDLIILGVPDDAENIVTRDDGFVNNMNKPVVAIYLGDAAGNYTLFAQDNDIVPAQDEFMFTENKQVEISKKGVITVSYSTFASAGSWTNDSCKELYRYQNGGFYRIGEEMSGFNRATHCTEAVSINYLTSKKCETQTNEKGRVRSTKWSNIEKAPLKRFGNR